MANGAPSVQPTPFPAPSKSASTTISGSLVTATSLSFTDKLLITITSSTSSGRLGHWIHVPLSAANPLDPSLHHQSAGPGGGNLGLLPRTDLTATTVLGGTKREEEVVGQTLATMIGSAVLMKSPGEERILVLGSGLQGLGGGGDGGEWFEEVIGLCLKIL